MKEAKRRRAPYIPKEIPVQTILQQIDAGAMEHVVAYHLKHHRGCTPPQATKVCLLNRSSLVNALVGAARFGNPPNPQYLIDVAFQLDLSI